MAKITWSDRQHTEGLSDAFPSFNGKFVPELNRFQTGITNAMRNGITLLDNLQAAKVTLPNCVHNVAQPFANPLYPAIPLFFAPYLSMLSNGQPGLPFVGGYLPVTPTQNGKFLQVTVQFQPPAGYVSLVRNAAQAIPSGTGTPIQWDFDVQGIAPNGTTVTSGAFQYDITTTTGTPAVNSKIICLTDGVVELSAQIRLNASSSGVERSFWVQRNNSGSTRWSSVSLLPSASLGFTCSSSTQIDVTAGTYLQVAVLQDSGSSMNTVTSASIGRPQQIQARYVGPPKNYSANVTGILFGG